MNQELRRPTPERRSGYLLAAGAFTGCAASLLLTGLLFKEPDSPWILAASWALLAGTALACIEVIKLFSRQLVQKSMVPATRSTTLQRAPGGRLRRFAQLCYSKKVYDRVFEPILSDLLVEYFEALNERDAIKARFVLLRGYGTFWLAVFAQLPVSLKRLVALWLASKIG